MRSRRFLPLSLVLTTVALAAAASAPAQVVPDYILMSRCLATADESSPPRPAQWQTGFPFVHIQDAGTGGGGWPERHSFQFSAYAYLKGQNGISEYGTGDDLCLGELKTLPGGGVINWEVLGSAPDAASGNTSITDSPNGNYGSNANGTATINQVFNLTGATSVELLYFHHHALRWNSSGDRCYVEVNTGGGWTPVDPDDTPGVGVNYYRYHYGDKHQFKRGRADLSAFAGNPSVQIRFRLDSDSSQSDDGWSIDDVSLVVDGSQVFFDDFESGTFQWMFTESWGPSTTYFYESNLGNIDSGGLYKVVPVVAPVTIGEGMGFNVVHVSYTILGQTRDAYAKVYHTAPQFVAAPDLGYEGICEVTVAIEDATAPIHNRLVLDQNSPNPFNPSTQIAFRLRDEGRARLRIYDEAGRLVRTLIDDQMLVAGEHTRAWDGRDDGGELQSSGIYLYKLEAHGQTVARKMVMVR